MTIRILFLGEGTSDSGITTHIERIATGLDVSVVITDPLLERLPPPPRRTVAAKLQVVKDIGGVYELVVVHRDGDREGRAPRVSEIRTAMHEVMPGVPHAPVVPIRMTEAWLLLDERELRRVAGNPNGRVPLNLPGPGKVESIPDPKAVLREKLAIASELNGRRLEKFNKRFSQHRRQLLERIDPCGPITDVPSWQDFVTDLKVGIRHAIR